MGASIAAMVAEQKVADQMADNNEKEAKEDAADMAEYPQIMAEYMAEYRQMMAEKSRRRAENNRRVEEARKQVAKKAWEEREREQQLAAQFVREQDGITAGQLQEARSDADVIHGYETGGPETVHEAAALRREIDDLRRELEDASTKIGALEAELATCRTRLKEKEAMEE